MHSSQISLAFLRRKQVQLDFVTVGCVLLYLCLFCDCFLHPLSFYRIILASGVPVLQLARGALIC